MGFLDNKGLKKVVNWVKDYVNANTIGEGNMQYKQDVWEVYWAGYIAPYKINLLNTMGSTIYFDALWGDGGSIIPKANKEYKIRALGQHLNGATFPSIFDMPWPNNEIPEWEVNHEYEIYIAGGRVVSIDDITPPVEEVVYTIESDQEIEFNITMGNSGKLYINGNPFIYNGNFKHQLKSGINIIKVNNSYSINNIWFNGEYTHLKVDCSKMKSNNLHKVLSYLKVDEIIYPQACIGSISNLAYNFEAPKINLRCLKYNNLHNPNFNFKTDNFISVQFGTVDYDESFVLFGKNISNKNANKILEQIYLKEYFSTSNLKNLKTVGTLYNSIGVVNGGYGYFKFCNLNLVRTSDTFHPSVSIEADEIIFSNSQPIKELIIYNSNDTKVVIENLSVVKYKITFNSRFTCTIYYMHGDPSKITTTVNGGGSINFIKVNSLEEVPFQYAPLDWDDVKNYDDEGNVIE